jgi:hypothetical protein
MIIWNFKTPTTFLASCIWNFCEYFYLSVGRFTPTLFGLMVDSKRHKKK